MVLIIKKVPLQDGGYHNITLGVQKARTGHVRVKYFAPGQLIPPNFRQQISNVEVKSAFETALQIETVQVGNGVEVAKFPTSYALWERLKWEDPFLPSSYYKHDDVFGPKAGWGLPAVGLSYEAYEKAAVVLSRLTGEDWYFPLTVQELLNIKDKLVVGENNRGAVWDWTSTHLIDDSEIKVIVDLKSGESDFCWPVMGYPNFLAGRFAKRIQKS